MKDIASTLHDFVGLFERLGISYAVMGGLAVRIYGIPRPTLDVDFTVALDRRRLSDFYRHVRELGYTVADEYDRGWVDVVAGMPIVKARLFLEGQGVDIDIFLAESPYQQQLLARRRSEDIDGSRVWFVSPEDLVLLKLISYRPRDVADIGDILFTQGRLDEDYMRRWAATLGVSSRLDEALAAQ
jgi:predicted nucleotidyltransferase